MKQEGEGMAVIEDLPLVVLDELFPRLDRESLIAASNVCVSWKKIVHDFTSRRISNVDFDLREKLEKCGWLMSEHDVESCRCIDLYTSLFKFIGNVPIIIIQAYISKIHINYKYNTV